MNEETVTRLLQTYFSNFGGTTIVVVALIGWLASLWQKRILQREQAVLVEKLEGLKKELGLEKSSYDHYLSLVMDYYDTYY